MSVQNKKRKSMEKANLMMGVLGTPFEAPVRQSITVNSPLTRPPRLEENTMNFINDIDSQHSGKSGSVSKSKKNNKEGSLLDHIKLPEPSSKLQIRDNRTDDQKSERSSKSKRKSKEAMLFNPAEFIDVSQVDKRDSSFQKISQRSNSKSQKQKKVKENSLFQIQNKNHSLEELMNLNYQRPKISSPLPSSMNDYSECPSMIADDTHHPQKSSQTQRVNNLMRLPNDSQEQKMGAPFLPASRTYKPQISRISNNISNGSSMFELSSQVLESSSNNRNKPRKKIFNNNNTSRVSSIGVHRSNGDDDLQLSDEEAQSRRVPIIEDNDNHLKVTQLKYSSTPPKNQQIKNDSLMFNLQHEPSYVNNNSFTGNQAKNTSVRHKKKGLSLLARDPSEDSSFDNASRGSSRDKKTKKPKDAILLPQTNNKYFDLPVLNSPQKPNDSFYEDPIVPTPEVPRLIAFQDDPIKFNTVGGQTGFMQKIPSMTSDQFYSSNQFDQSLKSLKYPTSKPPRSVSSKRSNSSSKESSLMNSGIISHNGSKKRITLSQLASQKDSQITKKSKEKKKESSLLQYYQNSSEDNRSYGSRDSRKSGKKQSSVIDMDRFNKKSKPQLNNKSKMDYYKPSQDDIPEIIMRKDSKDSQQKRRYMNIKDLQSEQCERRVSKKNCYFINQKGKLVKENYTIQLSGKSRSKQKQPSFGETQYGRNFYKQSNQSFSRKSSEKNMGRSRERDSNLNRSREKQRSTNYNDSSLTQFYRPRQEMRQQPMHQNNYNTLNLNRYYERKEDQSYTYEYYGDSEEEEVQRVSYNKMFSKNSENNSSKKLPRTQRSASKYNFN